MGSCSLEKKMTLPNQRKIDSILLERLAPLDLGEPCLLPDLPASAEAWTVAALARLSGRAVLWIGDGPRTLETFYRNLRTLSPPEAPAPLLFPSWESLPGPKAESPDAAASGARLQVLPLLAGKTPSVVATCGQALMELTLSASALETHTVRLARGAEADPGVVAEALAAAGYSFVPEVQAQAESSLRGGILDVWPLTAPTPFRIEFVGTEIESIRSFEPVEQKSIAPVESVTLPPASEWRLMRARTENRSTLVDYLPAGAVVVWSDADSIAAHALTYEAAIRDSGTHGLACSLAEIQARVGSCRNAREIFVGAAPDKPHRAIELDFRPVEGVPSAVTMHGFHPDRVEAARTRYLDGLAGDARRGCAVTAYFESQGTLDRFMELYRAVFEEAGVRATLGSLSEGFRSDELSLVVTAESDFYGRKIQRKRPSPPATQAATGARVSDWTDMEPGNLVVHVEHGVGRYLGLREITVNNRLQEALAIEYADGAKLYVPVSQAHLLTRYVGVGKRFVQLHQLGGKRWGREKESAERAIQDLAGSLLEIQASRDSQTGFAFPPDTAWQHELDASFPFVETEDQQRAIAEAKQDMESQRPMDRLLCGDAGYGKTEVAVRAAFKAVMAGKQVAVLLPTTVLAQQHFQTFTERIAPFPVRIEMLSRFCTGRECARTIQGLKEGTVDIVIGTHALLQPGIAFHDLGLVIIDEEQRFGVLHKERFKHLRRLVDVLTLTATPIPRTLYMSLTGARDLSTLQTPPGDRLAVETIVTQGSDEVIREAILRELNREGQAFYLHNRVRTIERVREKLRTLVPEAAVEVAHGQMAASNLAEVMRRFAAGEFDVLLCTTLIESGLDIPNANTILIDRADRFGLADLYQLRGRVGRSKHKSYAYMLLPTQAHVDPIARKRIMAIKQYSGAGAGFRLALRDLEIRGAGNLLGAEQSGHIAAVGFGLYCQLLRRTIAVARGETVPPVIDVEMTLDFISLSPSDTGAQHAALIPVNYVEDERLRVSMYRRIAEACYLREIKELRKTFRDRFGPLPPECQRLLQLAEIRIAAAERKLQSVQVEDGKIMLSREGGYVMPGGRFARLKSDDADTRLAELLAYLRASNKDAL